MAEDLVALGFSFSAGNADSEIQRVIDKLDELNTASDSAKQKLGKLFDSSFISRVDHATRLVGKFNSALQHTAGFAKNTRTQLRPLSEALNRVNPAAVKPISPAVLDSVVKLTAEIEKAAAAASKLKFSKARINSGAVTELATESRSAAGAVDSLADTFARRFQEGAALAYFQQATQQAIAFGEELAYIKTLALNFDISKVRSGLLNLSSELGPVRENATALYYAYSSGVEGTEADLVKFTAAMAKTAKVIRAKVLPTIDAATSAMNAYNVSSKEAVKIMPDLFFSIVKYGKASGEQLATGLGQVIATSATAGLTLDEMGASITSLTKTMQTRNAITYFNNMLSKLIKPSKGAMQAARALGIELGLDALRAKGFSNMMQELRDKTKDSQEALLRIFPDLRGQRAALQLLNKGWGDFQYQLQNFANKAGAADEAMRQLSADTNYQLSVLPVTFSKIRQGAGELIVNLITLGGTLTPVIAAFNNMGETGQAVAGAMTLMVGGYAILKGGMFVHRTAQAIEIRNNEILSAQRKKEIGERKAVAASVTAEAAARARAANTPLTTAASGNSATADKAAVTAAAAYYARVNAAKQAAAATQAENAASIRNLAVETQRAAAAKAVAAAKAEEANASYQSVAASVEKARAGTAEAAANLSAAKAVLVKHNAEAAALGTAAGTIQSEGLKAVANLKSAMAARKAAEAEVARLEAVAAGAGANQKAAATALAEANARLTAARAAEQQNLARLKAISAGVNEAAALKAGDLAMRRSALTRGELAGLIAMQRRQQLESAAAALAEAESQRAAALASGNLTAAKAAQKSVIAAKIVLDRTENKLLAAQNLQLKLNTALTNQNAAAKLAAGKSGAAANVFSTFTGGGFMSGFGRGGVKGMAAWNNVFKNTINQGWKSFLTGGITSTLGTGITSLATGIGKVAALAVKVFSPVNLIIGGALAAIGGLIDVLSSKGSTWSEKVGNSRVVSKVGEKIEDFFTGALTAAQKLQERMEMMDTLQLDRSDLNDWRRQMVMQFATEDIKALPVADQYKLMRNRFDEALRGRTMGAYREAEAAVRKYDAELQRLDKLAKMTPEKLRASADAEKRVLAIYADTLKIPQEQMQRWYAEVEKADGQPAQMRALHDRIRKEMAKSYGKGDVILAASKAGGVWTELEAELREQQNGLAEARKAAQDSYENAKATVTTTLERIRKNADMLRGFYDSSIAAIESVKEMVEKQKFSMLSPDQQLAQQSSEVARERRNYYQAVRDGDAAAAQAAFKSMLAAHNAVVKEAEKRINSMNKLNDTLKTDAFDYQLKSAKSVQEKIALLRMQAQQLYRESNGRWSRGRFLVPQGNADLTESYGKAKQAIELEIQAMQEEISRKQQLAEAERNANAQTVKLIQSMDKFKATTTTAVNANSLQAQELQSRRFSQLPNYTPVTQAQTSLTNSQNQLRELYRQAQELIRQYQQAAQQRQAQEAARRDKLVQDLNNVMADNARNMQSLEQQLGRLANMLRDVAEKVAQGLGDDKAVAELKKIRQIIPTTVSY
nr:MAG TPA: minor tail protein [Caudoviricetes sp.]